jgi:spermidine synthase
LGKKKKAAIEKKEEITRGKKRRSIAFYAFALSGAAALMYEVIWTRELSLLFGSSVYAVSTMLTSFMSGLTLGAYIGGKIADRTKNLFKVFGLLEFGIGVFGLITFPIINNLSPVYFYIYNLFHQNAYVFYLAQFLLSFLIMLIPTSLMGATFPVVSKIETKRIEELGEDVGSVYSINTLGSILGSFSAGFLIIPAVGIRNATLIAASLNIIVSLVMFFKGRASRSLISGLISVFLLFSFLLFAVPEDYFPFSFYHVHRYKTYEEYLNAKRNIKPVFVRDGLYGKVSVMLDEFGDYFLSNDGKIEGSTVITDQKTTSLLAHLPFAYANKPKKVLVIGLGTGQTVREFLKHPEVQQVECVEINPDIVDAARYFVPQETFDDPRLRIIIADGRHYLRTTDEKYDIISSEPSYPYSQGVSQLFTYEFYQIVKDRLNEDGIFCQWIPLYLLSGSEYFSLIRTFGLSYPYFDVWHGSVGGLKLGSVPLTGDAIFIGGKKPLKNYEEAKKIAMEWLPVKEDFSYMGNQIFYAGYLNNDKYALNTDDLPLLEFKAPFNHIVSAELAKKSY